MRRFSQMIPLTVLATALAGGTLAASPASAGAPPAPTWYGHGHHLSAAGENRAHVLNSAALGPRPTDGLYWRTQSGLSALPQGCRPTPSPSGNMLVSCPAEDGRSPQNP